MGVKGRKAVNEVNSGANTGAIAGTKAVARGILSGVIAGTLVSGLALGTASVLTDPVQLGTSGRSDAPDAAVPDVPAGSEFNQPRDDTTASVPAMTDSPEPGEASQASAPEPDNLASLSDADTDPADVPETGTADDALAAPQTGDDAAGVQVDSENPVLPSPQAVAPQVPQDEGELSISTDPAQPVMPDVAEESAAFPQDEAAQGDGQTDEPVAAQDTGSGGDSGGDSGGEAPADSAEATDPSDIGADTGEEAQSAEAPAEVDPEASAVAETTGSGTIGNLATEVETGRLPTVATADEAQDAAWEAVEGGTNQDGAGADDAGEASEETAEPDAAQGEIPLVRYAAAFENPDDKPLMSIILIDDGSSPVGLQALESFPYPLSFAVDSGWSGAGEAMTRYRDAGFEVLALANLPEGAGPQDAEVAMQAVFAAVPEAVAVMEGAGSGLQSSRAAAEQLAPILQDSGHGLVMFPKGLNTAQKLLAREGVPTLSVFRDFDAKGQNATIIRRFLDQAAFQARQEEAGVIMVGRLRPDTVSALLLWGLQDRASRVSLAPISALLRGGG